MDAVNWYSLVILPLIVFCARVVDVSLGTMRIIFTSRGKRRIAPLLGFVEVFIWIVVVSQVVKNVHSLPAYFGYAAGFAVGTYVGMKIEDRLALGTLIIRIILPQDGELLASRLREAGYGVTVANGMGAGGEVKLIFTAIPRKKLDEVTEIIKSVSPKAFFSVEELRSIESGIFPVTAPQIGKI
jgi:uncharacterized protein YebE (UPF0316 family)